MKLEQELRKLKNSAEGGLPRPDFAQSLKVILLSEIQRGVGQELPKNIGICELVKGSFAPLKYLFSPSFAYGFAILFLGMGVTVVAAAARSALPGEALYGTKLAVEKTQVRMVSNPASRARIQMEFAGNRLKEAKAITEQNVPANGRMDQTLTRFAKDVEEATKALKQAADPVQIKETGSELVKRAAQYKQELEETRAILGKTESAHPVKELPDDSSVRPIDQVILEKKPARQVGLAAIEHAEKALEEVEEIANKEADQEDQVEETGALEEGEVGL